MRQVVHSDGFTKFQVESAIMVNQSTKSQLLGEEI